MSTLGGSAPSQNTVNYDALLSTTLLAYRPVMVDNIFKSNSFLAALKKYGGIRHQNGGGRQPEMSIKSQVNSQLVRGTVDTTSFVPGNSAKDLLPLGYFMPKNNQAEPVA